VGTREVITMEIKRKKCPKCNGMMSVRIRGRQHKLRIKEKDALCMKCGYRIPLQTAINKETIRRTLVKYKGGN
jgi:RNase P subunit RPR2